MHITTMATNDATHPPMMPRTSVGLSPVVPVVASVVPATSKRPSIGLNGKCRAYCDGPPTQRVGLYIYIYIFFNHQMVATHTHT